MFVKSKDYDNAIQKVKINLGKELGMANEDDAHVTFREPSEKEVLLLKNAKDDSERLDAFKAIFEASVIDHDFFVTEAEKMEAKAVIDLLFEKMDTTEKLVGEYSKQVFRSRMTEAEEK